VPKDASLKPYRRPGTPLLAKGVDAMASMVLPSVVLGGDVERSLT
jgi:hypothetical protein